MYTSVYTTKRENIIDVTDESITRVSQHCVHLFLSSSFPFLFSVRLSTDYTLVRHSIQHRIVNTWPIFDVPRATRTIRTTHEFSLCSRHVLARECARSFFATAVARLPRVTLHCCSPKLFLSKNSNIPLRVTDGYDSTPREIIRERTIRIVCS